MVIPLGGMQFHECKRILGDSDPCSYEATKAVAKKAQKM